MLNLGGFDDTGVDTFHTGRDVGGVLALGGFDDTWVDTGRDVGGAIALGGFDDTRVDTGRDVAGVLKFGGDVFELGVARWDSMSRILPCTS